MAGCMCACGCVCGHQWHSLTLLKKLHSGAQKSQKKLWDHCGVWMRFFFGSWYLPATINCSSMRLLPSINDIKKTKMRLSHQIIKRLQSKQSHWKCTLDIRRIKNLLANGDRRETVSEYWSTLRNEFCPPFLCYGAWVWMACHIFPA